MKGPKELKRFIQKFREHLKRVHYDNLLLFKLETCKKYRKISRRPRDGYISTEKPLDMLRTY